MSAALLSRSINRCGAGVMLVCSLLAATVRAGTDFWQPLAPLEGGWIASMYYDPVTDTLYTGTSIQSSYGGTSQEGTLLRSTDHGVTWIDIGAGLAALTPTHRVSAITRTAAGVLWVALHSGGVAKSLDDGAHWSLSNTGLVATTRPRAIQFAPDGTGYLITDSVGVYISSTGGASWVASNSGLTNLSTRGLAFVGADAFVATRGGGVFRRTGVGAWSTVNVGLGSLIINSISVLPNGRLSASTDVGVWTMDIGTLVWTALPGPFTGQVCVTTLGVGTTLLVGGNNGIDLSTNGGANWVAADNGIPPTVGVPILAADSAGRLFAGTTRSGLFRSLDGASSWQGANVGIHAVAFSRIAIGANGTIHAGTFDSGTFRSTDGGGSWQPPTLIGWKIFAMAVSPWGDIFAGNYNITAGVSDGHVWRSQDDGQSWSMLGAGLPAAMISGFDFPATNEVNCTSAWNPGGVWNSSNNGTSWSHTGPTQNIPAYCLARTPNNDMYFGTEGLGVWRLPGNGDAAQNMGLSASQQLAIAADPQGRVYVGSDRNLSALWRTDGSGQAFVATALPGTECFAVLVLPSGTVYAGTRALGIQRSFDYGATWELVNSGIPTMSSFSLALGPDGHLYAGVPGGVFRSTAPVQCIADLNGDSAVDGADLVVLLSQWGGAGTADFDRDGLVSGGDLVVLLSSWGACPN